MLLFSGLNFMKLDFDFFFLEKFMANFFELIMFVNTMFTLNFFAHTHFRISLCHIFCWCFERNVNRYRSNLQTILKFGAIMNRHNLPVEIKSKIISLRQYTSMTFEEIAAQCTSTLSA